MGGIADVGKRARETVEEYRRCFGLPQAVELEDCLSEAAIALTELADEYKTVTPGLQWLRVHDRLHRYIHQERERQQREITGLK